MLHLKLTKPLLNVTSGVQHMAITTPEPQALTKSGKESNALQLRRWGVCDADSCAWTLQWQCAVLASAVV